MSRPTWSRRLTRRSVAVGAGLLSLGLVGGGVAVGATQQPAIHTSTPRTERDVTNIDVLRQQLRNYYGDPLGTGVVGPRSNYVREATKVAAKGTAYLAARSHGRHTAKQRAIVLDVDDTSLVTWNYEIASNWAYEPVSNAKYVDGRLFPAVPGMQQAQPVRREAWVRGGLPDRAPVDAGGRDARQPDGGRRRCRRRVRRADRAEGRRGRPVHQARGGRLPRLPAGRLRRRPGRKVHDDPLQVGDAEAPGVARVRRGRQLR
nr:hypothetical protein [Angustibacter aerolatus]